MNYDLADVEVNGQDILSFMDALTHFKMIGAQILQNEKIGTLVNGEYQIIPTEWYPLTDKIKILEQVKTRVGPKTLVNVGKKIPENAVFPPEIDSIHKAIAAINVAYHMNHRKAGKLMYDMATQQITDGIGYYGYEAVSGENKIISVCENPNLSEYDEGIVTAMAKKFQPFAQVTLDSSKPTRRNGDDNCTFLITW
ncbi:MAG: hypothetical protein AAF518_13095 [Spirochaetota bacterium]